MFDPSQPFDILSVPESDSLPVEPSPFSSVPLSSSIQAGLGRPDDSQGFWANSNGGHLTSETAFAGGNTYPAGQINRDYPTAFDPFQPFEVLSLGSLSPDRSAAPAGPIPPDPLFILDSQQQPSFSPEQIDAFRSFSGVPYSPDPHSLLPSRPSVEFDLRRFSPEIPEDSRFVDLPISNGRLPEPSEPLAPVAEPSPIQPPDQPTALALAPKPAAPFATDTVPEHLRHRPQPNAPLPWHEEPTRSDLANQPAPPSPTPWNEKAARAYQNTGNSIYPSALSEGYRQTAEGFYNILGNLLGRNPHSNTSTPDLQIQLRIAEQHLAVEDAAIKERLKRQPRGFAPPPDYDELTEKIRSIQNELDYRQGGGEGFINALGSFVRSTQNEADRVASPRPPAIGYPVAIASENSWPREAKEVAQQQKPNTGSRQARAIGNNRAPDPRLLDLMDRLREERDASLNNPHPQRTSPAAPDRHDFPTGPVFRPMPSIREELAAGRYENAGSMIYEPIRRIFSGLIGPTEKERFEKAIPWGKDPDGSTHYEYMPLGDRWQREQGIMTPFVKIGRYEPEPGDSTITAAGKAVFNVAAGIEESFLSPGGLATGAAGTVPKVGKAIIGAFGLDIAAHIPEQISAGLHADTVQGKIEGWLGTIASLAMASLAAKHVLKGNARVKAYPGPLKIKPMEGLSSEQAKAEARFARWIQEDLNRASQLYTQIPETENGRVIDVDEVRKLSPDYNFNKHSRTRHTLSVNSVAGTFVAKHLLPAALRKLRNGDTMGLTAGGPGSGKGTTIKAIQPQKWASARFVYDGVLRRYSVAKELIESARALGAKTVIWYVHAPIEQAVEQAMGRAESHGRGVPLKIMAESHVAAQETIIQLLEEYANDPAVEIYVIDNSKSTPSIVENPLDFLRRENIKYENARATEVRARKAFRANISTLSSPEARSLFEGRTGSPDGIGTVD